MKTAQNIKSCLMGTCLLLISSLGCMVTPGNLQEVASRATPIQFSGFTVNPGQKIELYARNANQLWVKIGETSSETKPYEHFDTKWYSWKKELVVPSSFWQQFGPTGGYLVQLKGVADKNELFTFEEGFYDYVGDYNSLDELYDAHKSPSGTTVIVWATK